MTQSRCINTLVLGHAPLAGFEVTTYGRFSGDRRGVTRKSEKLFRIHDSGDFFSAAYANAWYEVCRQLPDIRFWAPTRAWQLPTSTNAVDGLKPFRVLTETDSLMFA